MSLPSSPAPCSPFCHELPPSASKARFPLLVLRTIALKVPVLSTLETLIGVRRHPVENVEIFARCFSFGGRWHDASRLRVSEEESPLLYLAVACFSRAEDVRPSLGRFVDRLHVVSGEIHEPDVILAFCGESLFEEA